MQTLLQKIHHATAVEFALMEQIRQLDTREQFDLLYTLTAKNKIDNGNIAEQTITCEQCGEAFGNNELCDDMRYTRQRTYCSDCQNLIELNGYIY